MCKGRVPQESRNAGSELWGVLWVERDLGVSHIAAVAVTEILKGDVERKKNGTLTSVLTRSRGEGKKQNNDEKSCKKVNADGHWYVVFSWVSESVSQGGSGS